MPFLLKPDRGFAYGDEDSKCAFPLPLGPLTELAFFPQSCPLLSLSVLLGPWVGRQVHGGLLVVGVL